MTSRTFLQLASLTLMAFPLSAQTQTSPVPPNEIARLEPLTVTAQKREQPIAEVPITVAAFTGDWLEGMGVYRLIDVAPFVPGVFIQEQSPNFPGINIRGLSEDSTDPRTEARVSLFQDGVSISRAAASVTELFDLERLEVVKGPQGTLFGRSAEAGAISLTQNKPAAARAGQLVVERGNFSSIFATGFYNTPLGDEHFLGRVAFISSRREGNQTNLVDGSSLNGHDTLAVRPSLRWVPDQATTLDLIFNYERDRPSGTGFKSGVIPTSLGDTDPFSAAELTRGSALGIDRTTWGTTALFKHAISPEWTVNSTTALRDYDSQDDFDADGSRIYLLESSAKSAGGQFSQELRFNFKGNQRLEGFFGASYFRERGQERDTLLTDERQLWPFFSGDFRNNLLAAGVPAALLDVAVPVLAPFTAQATLPAGFAAFANPALPASLRSLAGLAGAPLKPRYAESYINSAHSESTDVFFDGTWRATDRWEFTGGARVSFERATAGYEAPLAASPSTLGFLFGASPNLAFIPTYGRRSADVSETGFVYRLATRYEFSPGHSAFATIGTGRRPPTTLIDNAGITPVQEETVQNYEVGLKGVFASRRFDYSLSAFHYTYRHFQTSVRDPSNAARFILIDAGAATGQGLEATLHGRISGALTTFASYGYTDATFDATDGAGRVQRFANSMFRLTARHTLALGGTVETSEFWGGRLYFTAAYQYRSKAFFDDDNTLLGGILMQPGFSLTNLRASWRARSGRWSFGAHLENLFNKNYLVDAGNFGASYNIPTFIRGDPRRYSASLEMNF